MHFHAPSEHTINGKHFDLELHLVHKSPTSTQLSVVAIFFDRKKGGDYPNPFFESLNAKDLQGGKLTTTSQNLPLRKLTQDVKKDRVYNYQGSLTTPTCDEIVNWIILDDPQYISSEQLSVFTNMWAGNQSFAKGNGNNRRT
jgi:carbonic anhydrase